MTWALLLTAALLAFQEPQAAEVDARERAVLARGGAERLAQLVNWRANGSLRWPDREWEGRLDLTVRAPLRLRARQKAGPAVQMLYLDGDRAWEDGGSGPVPLPPRERDLVALQATLWSLLAFFPGPDVVVDGAGVSWTGPHRIRITLDTASGLPSRLDFSSPAPKRTGTRWEIPSWALVDGLRLPARVTASAPGEAGARVPVWDMEFLRHWSALRLRLDFFLPPAERRRFTEGMQGLATGIPDERFEEILADRGPVLLTRPAAVVLEVPVEEGRWTEAEEALQDWARTSGAPLGATSVLVLGPEGTPVALRRPARSGVRAPPQAILRTLPSSRCQAAGGRGGPRDVAATLARLRKQTGSVGRQALVLRRTGDPVGPFLLLLTELPCPPGGTDVPK